MREFAASTASRGRMILVWLIDLFFFLSVWTMASFLFAWEAWSASIIPFIVFLFLKFIFIRFNTPGMRAMSINWLTREVKRDVYLRESRLSIFIGLILLYCGLQSIVQWTSSYTPIAWFGFVPGMSIQISLMIITGLISIIAGFYYLKVQIKGLALAISLIIFWITSILFSLQWWRELFAVIPAAAFKSVQAYANADQIISGLPFIIIGLYIFFLALIALTIPCFKQLPK